MPAASGLFSWSIELLTFAGLLFAPQMLDLSLIHISEPTRPLYISYAVFCLKKKN